MTDATITPASAPQVPSMSFVERALSRHKGLTRAQLVICEEFVRFPNAGRAQLAAAAGVDERTVARWMSDPQFWAVVGEFDLGKVQRQQALALVSAKLAEMLGRPGSLTAEDGAWLDRVAKWTGLVREVPQSLAVAVAGGGVGASVAARAEELSRGLQAELFGPPSQVGGVETVSQCGADRVSNSPDAAGGVVGADRGDQ